MYFGSRTMAVHLLRGALGFAALCAAFATMKSTVWPSIVLLPAALYLFRGCAVCWTLGLVEMVVMTAHRYHERRVQLVPGARPR